MSWPQWSPMTRMVVRIGGAVAILAGVIRLIMATEVRVLSVPVSCGSPVAFLAGADNGHPITLAVCTPSLEAAVVLGAVLVALGIAGLVSSARADTRPMVAGWYRSPDALGHVGYCRWWDGSQWTTATRCPMTGTPDKRKVTR